jgi:peptidoglycan/xylan/chitin deacetylase (PgdA/CDA1 family)
MSKLGTSEQVTEISTVTAKVKELTGYEMFLFRPPYGDYNSTLINTCYSLNYYPIQWDVDSLDWKDYGVDSIIKTVTQHKSLGNGSIVLMHNGAKFTADALESVITSLQNQGYELVPVSELIIRENFHMDANGTQIGE